MVLTIEEMIRGERECRILAKTVLVDKEGAEFMDGVVGADFTRRRREDDLRGVEGKQRGIKY